MKVAARTERPPASTPSPPSSLPSWCWPLLWLGVAVATAALVRLPGPAVLDPDEHAAALYFDRLIAGQRLEEPLLSAPKPLLTVVHGLAWTVGHDWRLLEALTVAAFALAVVCLARAAGRLAGWPAAAATTVAVAGSGPLVLQVARGNSRVFALAGWSVALDALTRPGPGAARVPARAAGAPTDPGAATGDGAPTDPAASTSGAAPGAGAAAPGAPLLGAPGGRRGWGLAAAALALAALARVEGWLLLPLAAAYGALAWRRGERRAALLLLPLAAPLLWLAHDWLLTGDPLYALGVPERYTDLVAGRDVVPPAGWLALVGRRYAADPLLLALAAGGVVWLARRRAWVWLAGLAVASVGVLTLLGLEAWRGTYISWRYFDPADIAVRLSAAIAAARLATAAAARLAATVPGRVPSGAAWVGATVGAVLLVAVACWPLAPRDPGVDSTLDRDTRLSANTAAAVAVLRPVAEEPGTIVAVSGPQRVRVALELELPLDRVRDLFLATRTAPLDRALAGTAAVFHDADGDRPPERFAPLSVTTPTTVGTVTLEPLRTDPGRGLYVHRVKPNG
ncbi:MAG TPA: hypothetical protein VGR74_03830 [Actinomycetota bacterium]|nr:hypothetical protein [Actinomycetota bacterium]